MQFDLASVLCSIGGVGDLDLGRVQSEVRRIIESIVRDARKFDAITCLWCPLDVLG